MTTPNPEHAPSQIDSSQAAAPDTHNSQTVQTKGVNVFLFGLVDLLAEAYVANLVAANDNHAPKKE